MNEHKNFCLLTVRGIARKMSTYRDIFLWNQNAQLSSIAPEEINKFRNEISTWMTPLYDLVGKSGEYYEHMPAKAIQEIYNGYGLLMEVYNKTMDNSTDVSELTKGVSDALEKIYKAEVEIFQDVQNDSFEAARISDEINVNQKSQKSFVEKLFGECTENEVFPTFPIMFHIWFKYILYGIAYVIVGFLGIFLIGAFGGLIGMSSRDLSNLGGSLGFLLGMSMWFIPFFFLVNRNYGKYRLSLRKVDEEE